MALMERASSTAWVNEYDACVKCGACLPVCPTYDAERMESFGPRGRVHLAGALLGNRLKATSGLTDRLTSCIDCKACVSVCPRGIAIDTLFNAAKEKLAFFRAMGLMNRWIALGVFWGRPLYPVLRVLDFLRRAVYERVDPDRFPGRFFPFIRNGQKRKLPAVAPVPFFKMIERRKGKEPKQGRRVVFFPGCVINFSETDIGQATLKVLNHYGFEVILPSEQLCCGIPLISMGERETAARLADKNIRMLELFDAEAVIVSCASCAYTFKKEYPLLLTGQPARAAAFAEKVWDIHEFLDKRVPHFGEGLGPLSGKVTWHDPCHLKRGLGVSESPRKILRTVPGLEFSEMKEADRCCGFGGIFSLKHYDLSMKVAEVKVRRIEENGAGRVATGCPGCSLHLTDALNQSGRGKVEVRHTVQLLAESISAGEVMERNARGTGLVNIGRASGLSDPAMAKRN